MNLKNQRKNKFNFNENILNGLRISIKVLKF